LKAKQFLSVDQSNYLVLAALTSVLAMQDRGAFEKLALGLGLAENWRDLPFQLRLLAAYGAGMFASTTTRP